MVLRTYPMVGGWAYSLLPIDILEKEHKVRKYQQARSGLDETQSNLAFSSVYKT